LNEDSVRATGQWLPYQDFGRLALEAPFAVLRACARALGA